MRIDWLERRTFDEAAVAEEPAAGTTEPAEKPITKADLDALRAEYDGKLEDANSRADYWYEQASQGTPAAEPEPEPDSEDDLSIIDDINKRGRRALDDYLKKKGFLSSEEAEELIQRKAEALQTQSKLVDEYPELMDKDSDLFKETARQMKALEGTGMRTDKRLAQAVFNAELKLIKAGKRSYGDSEDARLAHVSAQNGTKGRKGADLSSPPQLNAHQKEIAKRMGLSKEEMADIAKRSRAIESNVRTGE